MIRQLIKVASIERVGGAEELRMFLSRFQREKLRFYSQPISSASRLRDDFLFQAQQIRFIKENHPKN